MTAAIAAFPGVVRGQGAVPAANYRSYSRCLPDYLRILAQRAYNLRNQEIAKLTTTAAIRDRQRWVRKTFWKLVGGTPERTPLNARTVGSFEREGYRLEKVVYESRPKFFVPANLYVPTSGRPPFPGVLFQMGHAANGKAYQLGFTWGVAAYVTGTSLEEVLRTVDRKLYQKMHNLAPVF